MRNLFGTGALIAGLLSGLFWLEAAPVAGAPVAVIGNPWGPASAVEIIAAAHGSILRMGHWRWIAVAADDGEPAFHERLKTAGAWLLISPLIMTACLKDGGSA